AFRSPTRAVPRPDRKPRATQSRRPVWRTIRRRRGRGSARHRALSAAPGAHRESPEYGARPISIPLAWRREGSSYRNPTDARAVLEGGSLSRRAPALPPQTLRRWESPKLLTDWP